MPLLLDSNDGPHRIWNFWFKLAQWAIERGLLGEQTNSSPIPDGVLSHVNL
jgi:hypothetical protein